LDEALSESLEIASRDEAGTQARQEFGVAVATALRAGGQLLWIGGAMIGPDRADGTSPFEFGDDATVGLATVMQMAGEIVSGAILLLDNSNRYAAAALIRQLVEVEYLAWAFAEDEDEARKWMRSSKEERQRFWRPVHLRQRAEGRFRGTDYGEHCGKGGHPSPEGIYLLPDHYAPEASAPFWWCDMAIHAHSVWSYSVAGAQRLGKGDVLDSLEEADAMSEAEARWREADPLLDVLDEACERQARRRGSLSSILAELHRESNSG
jgi:hypothetical protein